MQLEKSATLGKHAYVVAQSPGRLRIEVPALYRSPQEKRRIEDKVARHEGIDQVCANPLTGRVLIVFHLSLPVDRVLVMLGITISPSKPCSEAERDRNTPMQRTPSHAPERKMPSTPAPHLPPAYPAWHLQPAEVAIASHGSDVRAGLSMAKAEYRLRYGRNNLPQPHARTSLDILLGQFKSLPVLLLGASALLSVLTGGVAEALAIAAVLTLNAGIGFATERRAESTIASLSELVEDTVPVVRQGQTHELPASIVVPGDLLVLAPGVRIAADARLVKADGLAVDESVLTGESRPVAKSCMPLEQDAPLAERINMAYMGTAVSAGSGLAVVVGTGPHTEIGTVQALMENSAQPKTSIQRHLDQLGNQLIAASVVVCAGVFVIGLMRGYGWLRMLKASISLAIAAVPEGLPTVATTSLARTIRLMRGRQMLVRQLQAVETLGSVHVICLDKTGTLTMNRMSVVEVQLNGTPLAIDNEKAPSIDPAFAPAWSRLLQICILCNEGETRSNGSSIMHASATEKALVDMALMAGLRVAEMRERYTLLGSALRADGRKYMATVRKLPAADKYLVAVKGSPAEVLSLCDSELDGERIVRLTVKRREDLLRQNERMAEKQLRVLGFAYAETSAPSIDAAYGSMVWVGLTGLTDPLRAGAADVIGCLHRAGIRTAMLTGDQSTTARAVGSAAGINNSGEELRILESGRLESMTGDALKLAVAGTDIFARISPAHKLEIVRALQSGGEVVAMTGDGINDGPALHAADVGIAMGLHGTDLARSAANVVLQDDRLETVLDAIREGRTLTINIRKSLRFLISSNMSEILVVLAAISTGAPPPMNPMQLLWVNLLGDVLPAIALAAEPAEGDVMQRPPRNPAEPLIGKMDLMRYARESLFLSGGALAAYGYGLLRHGAGARAGTIAFNSLMLGQLVHALSCRSDRRGELLFGSSSRGKKLNLAIAGSIGLQLIANLAPGLRRLLGVGGMRGMDIAVMLGGALVPLLLNEASKPVICAAKYDAPKPPQSGERLERQPSRQALQLALTGSQNDTG